MDYNVEYFEDSCFISTKLIEEAEAIARHKFEGGYAQEAFVWLLNELTALACKSRRRGLDAYVKKLEEGGDMAPDWLAML